MENQVTGDNGAGNEPRSSGPQRPTRKDYYSFIVIGNNGARINDDLVKSKITATEPKLVRRQLREEGWTRVRVFDRNAYNEAFKTYRDTNKQTATSSRDSIIGEAFETAEQGMNSRVVRALTSLLPLYAGVNERKVVDAFKKIVRVVAASTPNFDEKPRRAGGKSKQAQSAAAH